ncbi:kynureninase [Tieghemostelium lacteum]|uniref:Kynureninase n=1 Tax=Tieghemostelium lacteum TaxID=361077 RepID=A0A151ZSE9_TIELA|nr:kynureninase [Tieghemostelium lacteum]|eukprot:KYQ96859.1 kynureninase [Tieghemostelium lacteum]
MDNFLKYLKEHKLNINDINLAQQLDQLDELSHFREEFYIPKKKTFRKDNTNIDTTNEDGEKEVIYLVGNSLGLQSKSLQKEMNDYLESWRTFAVEGHHNGEHPYLHGDEEILKSLATIVGAEEKEVCPMNSLSVNLHIMMINFYRPTQKRYKIVIEQGAFPSDLYVAESQLRHHGFNPKTDLIKIQSPLGEGHCLTNETIQQVLKEHGESIALVLLSGVQYYTGQLFDIKEVTRMGHEIGAVVGWDLAHAVGNVELQLHDWQVDFACWCTYKYLNSGPGCIGCVFVHSKHTLESNFDLNTDKRLMGWFGNKITHRFHKEKEFVAEDGALGFRCSNPSMADLTSLRNSLNIINRATIQKMVKKQIILTGYLEYLFTHTINPELVTIITPSNPIHRGCQLSLSIKSIKATELKVKLLNNGVVCDVREPNVIRVAPTPLYNTFSDVYNFINILNKCL